MINIDPNVAKLLLALEKIRDSGISENSDDNRHCRHCNRFQAVIKDWPTKGRTHFPGHINPHDAWASEQYPSIVPVCVTANEAINEYIYGGAP